MAAPISPLGIVPPQPVRLDRGTSSSGEFASLLRGAVNGVEQVQNDAAKSAARFLSGESEEVHEAALASQRAELTFDLFLQTRNKVVSAYQEIMRMQM